MLVERRRGSAGSRLHVRLVVLFSVVAVTPSIVVALFATAFFNLGIQSWFDDRIRSALDASLASAKSSLEEHRNNIKADALGVAITFTRAGRFLSNAQLQQVLEQETTVHSLIQAVIFDPLTHEMVLSSGVLSGNFVELPTDAEIEPARSGEVAVIGGDEENHVRAVVRLGTTPELMLMVDRPRRHADHGGRCSARRSWSATYQRLDDNRSKLQITFAMIFALVALLVLSAAVLIGLCWPTRSRAPSAADPGGRTRSGGDLGVRVPEIQSDDELAGLSRAFNRMTGQLAAQRSELMDAYGQIDERRRVYGDGAGRRVRRGDRPGCAGPCRPAQPRGERADAIRPDGGDRPAAGQCGPRVRRPVRRGARSGPDRPHTAEVQVGPPSNRRTLLVRIGTEMRGEGIGGFVVTFDDITELQQAQRKAAWSDVARRIAHEIKNPLTPIQLAAERLKRRFTKEITSDPETFAMCADTIVRHVGDIGRMVDEFSAFARMPQPVIAPADLSRIVREVLMLQQGAHPALAWSTDLPERGPARALRPPADRPGADQSDDERGRRRGHAERPDGGPGAIRVAIACEGAEAHIIVTDDGLGLPEEGRDRLTEPYVTHKPKGTGLGLAIVKKIMEDHGGRISLDDRPERSRRRRHTDPSADGS